MPSYARVFTPRYKVQYISAGITHTVQVRSPRDTAISTVITNAQGGLHDSLDPLKSKLANDFQWLAASVADQDTDIFSPCALPAAVVGEVDWVAGNWSPIKRCHALTFYGRAASSHARLSFYGFDIDSDNADDLGADGLVRSTEWAAVATAAGTMSDRFRSGSGAPALFYPRATWKLNDALLGTIRQGLFTAPTGA